MRGMWRRLVLGLSGGRPETEASARPAPLPEADRLTQLIESGRAFQQRQDAYRAAACWDELGIGLQVPLTGPDVGRALHPSNYGGATPAEVSPAPAPTAWGDWPAGSCVVHGGRSQRARRTCRRPAPR